VAFAVTVYAVTRVGVLVFAVVPVCAGVYTAAYVVGAGKCGGLYPIGMWVQRRSWSEIWYGCYG
jgi:hypothetical protein